MQLEQHSVFASNGSETSIVGTMFLLVAYAQALAAMGPIYIYFYMNVVLITIK